MTMDNDGTVTMGSASLQGVKAIPVLVEATLRGQGSPRILGCVDAVVREAYHRVLAAFRACGVPLPRGYPTINFVPAGLKKTGSGFDLPMALALAGAGGLFGAGTVHQVAAFGEISLQGRILPVRGTLATASALADAGYKTLLTATEDARAAALVEDLEVIPVRTLIQALQHLLGEVTVARAQPLAQRSVVSTAVPDLLDIRGHETPKTALVVAATGGHNVLFAGPPGSGKSALLRRLPGLMPPPEHHEAVEIARIHNAASLGSHGGWASLPDIRPFRAPHHSSSATSLLGGGQDLRPGEVTLAHLGVLFLDELPEFRREALEGLRQPIEDGVVCIGRARQSVTMPAAFLLAAAMNPCPCGYRGHPTRPCQCPPSVTARYATRISGPLLDRIDLQVEVPSVPPEAWSAACDPAQGTAALRAQVLAAVDRQLARCRRLALPATRNGRLEGRALERATPGADLLMNALGRIVQRDQLSGRAHVRLLRIARTLADLAGRDALQLEDIFTAARLRGYERQRASALHQA